MRTLTSRQKPPCVGVKFPDRLEPLAPRVLDDSIGRELAAGPAVRLGGRVDPRAIVVEVLGARASSQAATPGRSKSFWGMIATKIRSSFFVHRDRPVLGNRVARPYFGASNGSVGSRSGTGSAATRLSDERAAEMLAMLR